MENDKLIQIVGPSFTNYSLARVNRGLGLALAKTHQIQFVSDSKFAERDAEAKDLANFPEVAKLLVSEVNPEAIVIYNNFPKDPNGPYGLESFEARVKIVYIAWEESVFPKRWVNEFNKNAHLVVCASSFVQEILQRSGLKIPTTVILNAIDNEVIERVTTANKFPLQTKKQFKFLHISSGYPRKGSDVLLKAFAAEFSAEDDVCLVLKSLPNALNAIPKEVEIIRKSENAPEIELINTEISDEDLAALTHTADAVVYPTRAEGFGLPIAEAMLYEKPVIATAYGAHLDFCTPENSSLIDFELVSALSSQLTNLGAKWAEPDAKHLQKLLREVCAGEYEQSKIKLAQQVAQDLTWENAAAEFSKIIPAAENLVQFKKLNYAVLSPIGDQTGISDYTNYLHTPIEGSFAKTVYLANSDVTDLVEQDAENVKRTWTTGEINFANTISELKKFQPEILHIEYHSGLYKPQALAELIENLDLANCKVFITLHSASTATSDVRDFVQQLSKCQQIFVHSKEEFEKLMNAGFKNVKHIVHGNSLPLKIQSTTLKNSLGFAKNYPILATHGLLTKQKGASELVAAAASLVTKYPDLLLILLNAVSPNNISAGALASDLRAQIKELKLENNVLFIDKFLTREQITAMLMCADVNVLAYAENNEAASGAVQKMIAAGSPLIMTDVKAFVEVKDLGLVIAENKPEVIAAAVVKLLENESEQSRQSQAKRGYLAKNSWEVKVQELLNSYSS